MLLAARVTHMRLEQTTLEAKKRNLMPEHDDLVIWKPLGKESSLRPLDTVRIKGLTARQKGEWLNGKIGKVIGYFNDNGRRTGTYRVCSFLMDGDHEVHRMEAQYLEQVSEYEAGMLQLRRRFEVLPSQAVVSAARTANWVFNFMFYLAVDEYACSHKWLAPPPPYSATPSSIGSTKEVKLRAEHVAAMNCSAPVNSTFPQGCGAESYTKRVNLCQSIFSLLEPISLGSCCANMPDWVLSMLFFVAVIGVMFDGAALGLLYVQDILKRDMQLSITRSMEATRQAIDDDRCALQAQETARLEMDADSDGLVDFDEFELWTRRHRLVAEAQQKKGYAPIDLAQSLLVQRISDLTAKDLTISNGKKVPLAGVNMSNRQMFDFLDDDRSGALNPRELSKARPRSYRWNESQGFDMDTDEFRRKGQMSERFGIVLDFISFIWEDFLKVFVAFWLHLTFVQGGDPIPWFYTVLMLSLVSLVVKLGNSMLPHHRSVDKALNVERERLEELINTRVLVMNGKKLDLRRQGLKDAGAEALSEALVDGGAVERMVSLNLSTNSMSDYGIEKVAEKLAMMASGVDRPGPLGKSLSTIDLSDNDMRDNGCYALMSALINLHGVQKLKLERNQISDMGAELLYTAIVNGDLANLKALDLTDNLVSWPMLDRINVACVNHRIEFKPQCGTRDGVDTRQSFSTRQVAASTSFRQTSGFSEVSLSAGEQAMLDSGDSRGSGGGGKGGLGRSFSGARLAPESETGRDSPVSLQSSAKSVSFAGDRGAPSPRDSPRSQGVASPSVGQHHMVNGMMQTVRVAAHCKKVAGYKQRKHQDELDELEEMEAQLKQFEVGGHEAVAPASRSPRRGGRPAQTDDFLREAYLEVSGLSPRAAEASALDARLCSTTLDSEFDDEPLDEPTPTQPARTGAMGRSAFRRAAAAQQRQVSAASAFRRSSPAAVAQNPLASAAVQDDESESDGDEYEDVSMPRLHHVTSMPRGGGRQDI